ncbi:hypothetical protein [Neorhizobium galegae]|nr:hypothetical protein [Neorhizobium galegae]MCM2498290.1 hypothetical protein [Neorhizobium galegae]MCQ1765701.1 hypothetical protein [Neorhizobium galegae]MCQ1774259.1 hypothetical protein [Neorhizobium galegae]MCQ1779228.1 hypothetical protein [Neorhizobium galegae]MCQ1795987.1 hypothetical protein [Neorhizobium galegae]
MRNTVIAPIAGRPVKKPAFAAADTTIFQALIQPLPDPIPLSRASL